MQKSQLAKIVQQRLIASFPNAKPELVFSNPFEFLIAVILSAQTTDVSVNKATPALFKSFPTPQALAQAQQEQVEELIHSLGFYKQKAKAIIGAAQVLVDQFAGQIPRDLDELVTLPGVGRKTANVVLSQAFGLNAGIAVDTHVGRIARRLGLTAEKDADKVADTLEALLPQEVWGAVNLVWVLHGRRVCEARKPKCQECRLADICPRVGV